MTNYASLRYAFCLNHCIKLNFVDVDLIASGFEKVLCESEDSSFYSGFVYVHQDAVSPC